ncbi:DUF6918 family protein [Corynebacterium sp. 32222D000AT]|uniref:DUF6918 family protein n=1 Tax=unclassified Corynebacterium TaxID=2624378 RepID=UPI002A939BAC|nr:hypothetical protein [Mycobacteriaceae bacterium]MDY5829191.1 hypothetical protein [Corynebacterium sp.]
MTATNLSPLLKEPRRNSTVSDLEKLADKIIDSQTGISGFALKAALKAATKVRPNVLAQAIDRLLPDVLGELEGYWQEFSGSNSDDFGVFLAPRSQQVTDSLLAVADQHAEKVNNATLAKAYQSLRGKAAGLLEPYVTDMGQILQRNLG